MISNRYPNSYHILIKSSFKHLMGWHRQLGCNLAQSTYRKPRCAKPRSANPSSVKLKEESDQK